MATSNGYGRLGRVDLKGFDRRAQNIVLMAMERGGEGRISNKGHAILRSPNGETMSVSKNTGAGNRGLQNMEADFRRCFADLPLVNETDGGLALAPEPDPVPQQRGPHLVNPTLDCPVESCEAVFVTEGARYSHVHKEHYPCKHPGCMRVFDKANKASGHYNVVHRREELRSVPAECPEPGCDWKGMAAGLPGHKKVHPKKKPRKAAPKKQVPAKAVKPQAKRDLAAELDAANARIAALEATVERLRKALA